MDNQNDPNKNLGQGGAQGAGSQQQGSGSQSDAQHGGGSEQNRSGMNVAPTQFAESEGQEQDRMPHGDDRQQGGMHQGGEQGGQQGKGGSNER